LIMSRVRCALFSRLRGLPLVSAIALGLILILPTACSDEQPTEARADRVTRANLNLSCAEPCFIDNFTDTGGTLLENHVPDGGTNSFAWAWTGGSSFEIRNNAVTAINLAFPESGAFGQYITDVVEDAVEIEVDVFAEVSFTQHDVAIDLRHQDGSGLNSYTIYWSIGGFGTDGRGSIVSIEEPGRVLASVDYSDGPVPIGVHTMRAEVLEGGVINVYIDGALAATATDSSPLPPGRVGLSFGFTATPSSVRITSFAAGPASSPQQAIQVDCVPEFPMRGETIECTAELAPGAGTELAVSKWTFVGLAVPSTVIENTSSTNWSGIAAFGGTILVEATVDGVAKTGQGNFLVDARDWSQMKAVHVAVEEESTLPIHPTEDGDLGETRSFTFGFAPSNRIAQVTSGPNRGWYYATAVPIIDSSKIQINRAALAKNSDFYKRHTTRGGSFCPRSEVLAFLPKAIAHEGLNFEVNSHAWAYSNGLDQTIGDLVEGAVGPTPEDLAASARDAAGPAIDDANEASERIDIDHPIETLNDCIFNYF
jgi:hypothetical protein